MLGGSEANFSVPKGLSKRVTEKAWLCLRKDCLKKSFLL